MNLTIIVDSIPSVRARSIIARHLAHGPSISLKKANQMVESTPFVYAQHLSKTDAARELANLKKLGCRVRLVRSDDVPQNVESHPEPRAEGKTDAKEAAAGGSEMNISETPDDSGAELDRPDSAERGTEEQVAARGDEETGTVDMPEEKRAEGDEPITSDTVHESVGRERPTSPVENTIEPVQGQEHEEIPGSDEPDGVARSSQRKDNEQVHRSKPQTASRYSPSVPAKKNNRRKQMITSLAVILCIVLPILILLAIQEPADRRIAQTDSVLKQGSKAAWRGGSQSMKPVHKTRIRPRSKVSKKQKQEAVAYVDSAADSNGRYDMMIRFYMIAISFNPYNVQAWYGLIAALEDAGRNEEARKARRRMEKLFGSEVFDVGKLVAPYGQLIDFSTHRKRCRVEYRAKSATRDGLEREAYRLARAFRARNECRDLVLHAETGLGSGMVTRIALEPFPQTMSHFRREAKMIYAD